MESWLEKTLRSMERLWMDRREFTGTVSFFRCQDASLQNVPSMHILKTQQDPSIYFSPICMCVCVWAQGHVCEGGGASSWEWMWVSHSIGNTPIWLEWLPRKPHGSAYHLLPSSGIIGVPLHLAFTWVLRVDLRSLYLDSKHDCLNCAVNPQQNNLE